jgi:hypothetical protein
VGVDEYTYFGYTADQTVTRTAIVSGGTQPYNYSWTLLKYAGPAIPRPLICNNINASGDEQFYLSNTSGTNICGTAGKVCTGNICPTSGTLTTVPVLSGINASRITLLLTDSALVQLTVTDANGCTGTDEFIIIAEDVRCFAGNSNIHKVKICHQNGNSCKAICVDSSSVETHLAHGDFVGACTPSCFPPTGAKYTEQANGDYLIVFPNPAHNQITVEFIDNRDHAVQLKLFDLTGRIIRTENFMSVDGINSKIIDLKSLSKGVYLLEIHNGKVKEKSMIFIE